MKIKTTILIGALLAWANLYQAAVQGTAFTYQGRLNSGGNPANGNYDFQFRLSSSPSVINYVGPAFVTNAVPVSNGLFTVALDFGPGIFTGSNYWLEVDVRTNGTLTYAQLLPLQAIAPTPYAMMANSASNLLGTLPVAKLSGAIPTSQLANNSVTVNAGTGLTGGGAISLGGASTLSIANSGVTAGSYGSASAVPTFTVNSQGQLTVAGSTAIAIPGSAVTSGTLPLPRLPATVVTNNITIDTTSLVLGNGTTSSNGTFNVVLGYDATADGTDLIAIGYKAAATYGTNYYFGSSTAVGYGATVNGDYATALGSAAADGDSSVALGNSWANADYAVALGNANAKSPYSFAAGYHASATNTGAFVCADGSSDNFFYSVRSNEFAVRAAGGARFVTGGAGLTVDGPITGNGSGLTNVALLNATNLFAGTNTFANDVRINGLLRLGSETNTASGPGYPPSSTGAGGLVIRRISSTSDGAGTLVARTDALQLQRDGTVSGLQMAYNVPSGYYQTINAIGITTNNTQVIYRNYLKTGAGTLYIFNDNQKIVHYDISFGNVYNAQHTCHVVLDRYDDGSISDYFLVGTIVSTYNQ